ncbi:hypothetical protein LJR117_000034 [Acidovorax sp. LjRoot117]
MALKASLFALYGLPYPRHAPALGIPLHSLCSLRSRSAALSSDEDVCLDAFACFSMAWAGVEALDLLLAWGAVALNDDAVSASTIRKRYFFEDMCLKGGGVTGFCGEIGFFCIFQLRSKNALCLL